MAMKRKPGSKSGVDARSLARGLRLRRGLVGAEHVMKSDLGFDPALMPAREILLEHVWGKIWTRKAVDLRTRSFMTIVLLTALDRPNELMAHLRVATVNGLSREEIGEAILHAAAYCGVPAGIGALAVARQYFNDADKAGMKSQPGTRRTTKAR